MDEKLFSIIDSLEDTHRLPLQDYEYLVSHRSDEGAMLLARKASAIRDSIYGRDVFVRGLIEFSNICKNDCLYCGIRKSNSTVDRYRLTEPQILACCKQGYDLGFRTFVLQGGEDGWFTDERLVSIISKIRAAYPDCAITLSLGERDRDSYQRLFDAGANRYLLRHETADKAHYERLHPAAMSFDHRMQCLQDLRDIGYDVGIGMMVGSPYQTPHELAEDMKFIEEFQPEMCGIGPFIPAHDTPFADFPAGTLEETCYLLSIIRLIVPDVLLPATTALGTISPLGRERGIQCGANVIMPNLSPVMVRKKYMLYDNKICTGEESAQCRTCLDLRMDKIGYTIVSDRGDIRREKSGSHGGTHV